MSTTSFSTTPEVDTASISERRKKISEIHKSMDFKSEGNFKEALKWLNSNLYWINDTLINCLLELEEGNIFKIKRINCSSVGDHNCIKVTHAEWISGSKRLIDLFEKNSLLFGQLACLKTNWRLGHFMENDVKYLRDYLKTFSISIQEQTLDLISQTTFENYQGSRVIKNVYSLCSFLALLSKGRYDNIQISENFLLPSLLFMNLIRQAGLFQESFECAVNENENRNMEEGIMLVFSDGDVDSAVDCIINNYLFGPEQGIWLMKKVLVQESVYDYFIRNLLNQIDKIEFTPIQPKKEELEELDKLISEAKSLGIEVYETKLSKTGLKSPVIFKGEPPSIVQMNEVHLLLPFIATQSFRTAEECITLANNSIKCSNASLWTESQSRATKVHKLLKMNTVWLNAHGIIDPLVPIYCPTINRYFSIKWDIHCSAITNSPCDSYKRSILTSMKPSMDLVCLIQNAEKAQKDWQKVDLLQRAKILSDIAYKFRESSIENDEFEQVADIFFHFAEECHRSTNSSSIVTDRGLYLVSFEPIGLVCKNYDPDLCNFEALAYLAAPLICHGNSTIVCFDQTVESIYREFQNILLSSGLPENLFNIVNKKCHIPGFSIDETCSKLRELLIAGEYNRKAFSFVLRTLTYYASFPKVLWIPN